LLWEEARETGDASNRSSLSGLVILVFALMTLDSGTINLDFPISVSSGFYRRMVIFLAGWKHLAAICSVGDSVL